MDIKPGLIDCNANVRCGNIDANLNSRPGGVSLSTEWKFENLKDLHFRGCSSGETIR